jgi:hypothetical protein
MTWVMLNIVSILMETVLVSVQDRCTVCAKRSIGSEIILNALDGAPSVEVYVEAHFGPFGDSANHDTRLVHDLHRTYHKLGNQFRCTQWNS